MRDQRKTEIKVGITVIIAIAIGIWILTWAKNYSLHSNQNTIEIQFESVSGLEKGDPVTINGVRKGFVDDILIHGNSAIVKATIESDVNLKKDATFAVLMLDLMGGKKIEVKPGISEESLNYGKLHNGIFYADIPQVMAIIGTVQDDLINIIKDMQVTLSSINGFLADKEFNSQLKASLKNLTQLSSKLNGMIDENRKNINLLVNNTSQLSGEAVQFFQENKEQINSTLTEVEKMIQNTNELLIKVNKFSDETANKNNNIGKLLYDENLIEDLKTSLKQVRELTNTINEQINDKGINVDANVDLF